MAVLWVLLTLVAAAGLGWPVTTGILSLARTVDARESEASGEESEEAPAADPETARRVLRGGLVIGLLERLAVAVAILTDQPVAIAYIVAVKGLGRYAELRESPAASERFIIGTLASLLWAAACAVLARLFLLR